MTKQQMEKEIKQLQMQLSSAIEYIAHLEKVNKSLKRTIALTAFEEWLLDDSDDDDDAPATDVPATATETVVKGFGSK